ncbi:hypothetical protein [Candidatus Palauibacter sp.]|uniref:hypothetical protein n=1 Tax=Candidatus Palauibacter sp. TaxID=3101350 RepID=UPI003B5A8E08
MTSFSFSSTWRFATGGQFVSNHPIEIQELVVGERGEISRGHGFVLRCLGRGIGPHRTRVGMSVENLTLITVIIRLIRRGDDWVIPTILGALTPAEKLEPRALFAAEQRRRGIE